VAILKLDKKRFSDEECDFQVPLQQDKSIWMKCF
jgi:hypothetical protein